MKYRIALNGETPPDLPEERFDGVGMIRGEYILRKIGKYITTHDAKHTLYAYVESVCQKYNKQEVWYRTTEFVTPEINVLEGVDAIFEEKHYILGMRGVRRGLKFKETFKEELRLISDLSTKYSNLNILIPYIKDPDELKEVISLLNDLNYKGKYGIMLEIPSVYLLLKEFSELNVSNITIGINDLTMLTLGTFRGSEYHDPTHPAILKIIRDTACFGKESGIEVNVAGYISDKLMRIIENEELDHIILHYKDIPDLLALPETDFPETELLKQIKNKTKQAIEERQ